MTTPIFPANLRGLTYPEMKSSAFNTLIQPAPNKLETRIAQTYNPVWEWSLIYDFIEDDPLRLPTGQAYTDYRRLQGFILGQQGSFADLLYNDPSDNAVGPALLAGAPNPQAQLQLVNDGAGNYYSPIQRNFGGLFYEDITDLNGAINVYANGALQAPANYQVLGPGLALPGSSYMGLYLKWVAMPAGPITAQFNFYFRARLAEDTQDFEQFMNALWTIGGSESRGGSGALKLTSSRPVQA